MKYIYTSYIALLTNTTYAFKLFLYSFVGVCKAFIYYFLWSAIYVNSSHSLQYHYQEIITYVIVAFAIQSILPRWVTMELARRVRSGDIVLDLLRPLDLIKYYLFFSVGDLIIFSVFMSIPLFIVGFVIIQIKPCQSIIIFLISLLLAYLISYFISFIIGLLSFWTTNIWGIFTAFETIGLFLSGALIPLDYMPVNMQSIFNILPFRAMIDIPLSVYLGKYNVHLIIFQLIWLLVLFFIACLIFKKATKKFCSLGG